VIKDKFGQYVYNENDIFNVIMNGTDMSSNAFLVNNLNSLNVKNTHHTTHIKQHIKREISVEEFDSECQQNWHMPAEYKTLDIAKYILSLCTTQEELQRCGDELMLYQSMGLFDLLCYLKYLVDTMEASNIIWGVGRGSSVASFVLFKLKIHKVNSMFYKLNVTEFLR
jgi:DNA polymerase III alpha subunit